MTAVDEVIAALAAGKTVKPADYAAAKAADELEALTDDARQRAEMERAAIERRERIHREMLSLWAEVDEATDEAERQYRKFIDQHAALCAAVDRMQALALGARAYVGKNNVAPEEAPPANGRGAFDIDALGACTVKVAINGGSHVMQRWPVAGMYFDWVRNRRNKGTVDHA